MKRLTCNLKDSIINKILVFFLCLCTPYKKRKRKKRAHNVSKIGLLAFGPPIFCTSFALFLLKKYIIEYIS